jgi:hypothetical protein
LYGVWKLVNWIAFAVRARKGGWVVYEDHSSEVWVRKGGSWNSWLKRLFGKGVEDDVLSVDGGTGERSYWIWSKMFPGRGARGRKVDERRALLS